MLENSLTQILISFILAGIFFWTFFDRSLKNHVYLFWYGMWNVTLAAESVAFATVSTPFTWVIPLISNIGLACLFTAAKKFVNKRESNYVYYLILAGFLLQLFGGLRGDSGVALIGILLWVPVYFYNYYAVSRFARKSLRNLLLISTLAILGFRFLYVLTGPEFWSYSVMSVFRTIVMLAIIGIHLQRLQRERDFYRVELYEVQEALRKVDQIESNLLKLISECDV